MIDGLGEVARNDNGLATRAMLFQFTLAAEMMFLATYCTVGGAIARARQMSQGEATTVLD